MLESLTSGFTEAFTTFFAFLGTPLGFLLYWIPVAICIIAGIFYILRHIEIDKKEREAIAKLYQKNPKHHEYFRPTVTIGTIVGRIFVSFIPVVNLWKGALVYLPRLAYNIYEYFEKVLDIPLVKKLERPKETNDE